MELKPCTTECKHCQKYNDEWCICWHPAHKGSKKQMKVPCLVALAKLSERGKEHEGD